MKIAPVSGPLLRGPTHQSITFSRASMEWSSGAVSFTSSSSKHRRNMLSQAVVQVAQVSIVGSSVQKVFPGTIWGVSSMFLRYHRVLLAVSAHTWHLTQRKANWFCLPGICHWNEKSGPQWFQTCRLRIGGTRENLKQKKKKAARQREAEWEVAGIGILVFMAQWCQIPLFAQGPQSLGSVRNPCGL